MRSCAKVVCVAKKNEKVKSVRKSNPTNSKGLFIHLFIYQGSVLFWV
jgi:hypothetical protein